MRLMIDAERPEALWLALRTVQAVLRESPSALACSSSVRNPADLTASASSLILEDCRAFILAVSGSGRWVRACTRASEDANVRSVVVVIAAPQLLALLSTRESSVVCSRSTLVILQTRCGPISE